MGKNNTRFLQWFFVTLVLTVVVGYNGCGDSGFNASYMTSLSSTSALKSACDAQLMQVYSQTYFPLLSTNCNRCHSGAHGSTDINVSFQAFMQKGVTLINYQATHPHGDNGIDLTSQIAAITPTWNAGQTSYMTCLASNPGDGGGGDNGDGSLLTSDKTATNIASTIAKNTTFVTISWDLSTEVADAGQKNMINAVFSVDVKYSLYGTPAVPVGLEFKNPRMHLKTAGGAALNVTGLVISLDDQSQDRVTTWSTLNASVSTTTDVSLAPGSADALAYYPTVVDGTKIAFRIQGLGVAGGSTTTTTTMPVPTTTLPGATTTTTTLPAVVTFTQLNSNDVTLGVFKQSCTGCHSGSNPAGFLDLTNYATSKSEAATIQSRITNAAVPMPPQGLLSQDKIDIVNKWVNGGAPQ